MALTLAEMVAIGRVGTAIAGVSLQEQKMVHLDACVYRMRLVWQIDAEMDAAKLWKAVTFAAGVFACELDCSSMASRVPAIALDLRE